jgi:hypothetical protein
MPNLKNKGVRRRFWKKAVKAAEIGNPLSRTEREFRNNSAFAAYMREEIPKREAKKYGTTNVIKRTLS